MSASHVPTHFQTIFGIEARVKINLALRRNLAGLDVTTLAIVQKERALSIKSNEEKCSDPRGRRERHDDEHPPAQGR